MTAKITATTTATWSFGPTTMTVNGRTFGASYSVARGGDVYVFTGVQAAPGAQRIPVRMHITQDMPMHADALAAARLAAETETHKADPTPAEAPKAAKPATVQDAPKAQAPAPVQADAKPAKAPKAAKPKAKPAPVQEAPKAQAPAPVQADAKPAKAPKAAKPKAKPALADAPKAQAPAPVEAPKAQAPAPVQDAAQAVCKPAADAAQAVCKAWIGSTITGKGWRIVFDGDAQRTRVIFDAKPTAAVSEPRVVRIPAELRPYLTIAHDAAIVPAGDWAYLLSEILTGGADETPALAWYGKDGRHRRVKLADVGAE